MKIFSSQKEDKEGTSLSKKERGEGGGQENQINFHSQQGEPTPSHVAKGGKEMFG